MSTWEQDKKHIQRMFSTYVGSDMEALIKEAIDDSSKPLLINNISEICS